MNRQPIKRSTLFLMELIIVILFFCLSGTLCIQLFVNSHLISNQSQELTMAVNEAATAAAVIDNPQDTETLIHEAYPNVEEVNDNYIVYYDKKQNQCSAKDAVYSMNIQLNLENDLHTGEIKVYNLKDNTVIYELEVQKHQARKP